jgi:hypothetical protein
MAGLESRAKRYGLIIQLLYSQQKLSGSLKQVSRGARHLSFGIRLANPLQLESALKLAEPMALNCGVNAILAQRQQGLVTYQVELPNMYWQYFTRQDLTQVKAIGLAEQRKSILFDFDPPHALIAGTTGSGKSETVKSILVAMMNSLSPLELGVILIDPNEDYLAFQNEAHLILPIATELPDIENALLYANQELAHRKRENIKGARTIVIAVDEADSVLKNKSFDIAKTISKQGRKYRIHLLIATQKPLHSDLPGLLDNLMNKFIGQLSDAGTSARVTGHAGLQAHKLTPKGDFLHIAGPDVNRFQVAMATDKDFDNLERKEVNPVKVHNQDIIELPPSLPEPSPGRPRIELNPQTLAAYFYYGPPNITQRLAQELFGMNRTGHILHRDFCNEMAKEYLRLKQSGAKLIGA